MPPPGTWSASRRLLQRLRDIMAAPASAQARLDRVAKLIAAEMVAEVCSIYVVRAGNVLELFATEGLKQEAVHRTRLRVGEGLVGDIAAHARPLNLAEAQTHPQFAFRPETGEEVFHSLCGVPVLRGGRVVGVLAVQNRTPRQYTEEEIETLETIAMVLAELVASGELVNPAELLPADGLALLPLRLEGLALSGGLAIGVVVPHRRQVVVRHLVAEDPAHEMERLRHAVAQVQDALDAKFAAVDPAGGGEHGEVLETFRMFARDRGWLGRIGEAIRTGLTAEAAVRRVLDDTRARMSQIADPYLRERLLDLEDLNNRLLVELVGAPVGAVDLPDNAVLVARDMGPAELLDYDRGRLAALLLEEGSPTAHVAIVARALDLPVVGRLRGISSEVEPGDPIIVDADNAVVFVRPGEDVRQTFFESMEARARQRAAYAALRDQPAVSADGVAVALLLNAGLLIDVDHLDATGAPGIGLYRTEIPFMVRPSFPDVAAQADLYRRVLDKAAGREVVFRTLDVGGDKLLPYLAAAEELNPAMGWRAIRIGLDRPMLLRRQLRALILAARGGPLAVMFPMIAEVAELMAARRLLDIELAAAADQGAAEPQPLAVGVMVEVPALLWQLDALLGRVDFLSIGSNDLMQFLFASDRSNPRLADRYDVLSPAALGLLGSLARRCAEAGVPATVCGEMAGQPLEAMALIGLGFRRLSMAAPVLGPVKAMLRSLAIAPLADYMVRLAALPDHSVRAKLRAFARDHGVEV